MRISDLGEFGLIELVQEWTRPSAASAGLAGDGTVCLTIDNGDDAAASTFIRSPVTEFYTTDTMVDGIHFTGKTTPWEDLGWKSLASNISDIAAMGGTPTWALVTLGLPGHTLVDHIRQLYQGMNAICREYGVRIIGGDMVSSPVAFVTVALTGVSQRPALTRFAAQPGHQVAVTGPVGGSAGGLKLLLADADAADLADNPMVLQHRRPRPHINEGQALVDAGVRVAMDVSDGLADDLAKLCKASGVAAGIMLDRVPVLTTLQDAHPADWRQLALYGGEDYVLVFTAPPDVMALAIDKVPTAKVIGEISAGTPGDVVVRDSAGNVISRDGSGWDHFAGSGS
jgi:thiamine-monophosphate kinase